MDSNCRNCLGNEALTVLFNDPTILKCSKCSGYQFVGEVGELAELYNENYFNGSEYINYNLASLVYRKNFFRKLELIMDYCSSNDSDNIRVLEIGCANGEFLQVLLERGISKSLGVEASQYSRSIAKQRGFSVVDPHDPNLMGVLREFRPNIVCAWDVWEHLEKPAIFFKNLIDEIPSIELIAVSTVDSGAMFPKLRGKRWRQFHPPTHLNYPTKHSFSAFFKNIGFELCHNCAFGYFRPLADYFSVFFSPSTLTRFPILFKIPFYLNLGDIQMTIAKKLRPSNQAHQHQ